MFPHALYPSRLFPPRLFPPVISTEGSGYGMFPHSVFPAALFPGRMFCPVAGAVTPADLVAAVVSQLRTFNAGAFATALGDSTATPKIWVDCDMGSPDYPWVRVMRPMGTREYSSDGNFIETGQLQVSVFSSSYAEARSLAWQVSSPNVNALGAGALDDPDLIFTEGTLMSLRLRSPSFVSVEGTGVGATRTYHAVMLFDYRFSGQIA